MNPWELSLATVLLVIAAQWRGSAWWARRVRARFPSPHPGSPRRSTRGGRTPAAQRLAAAVLQRLRRRVDLADDVAPTLEAMARAVAAGTSLGAALDALGPARPERPFAAVLAPAADEHRLGAPLGEAMDRAATRHRQLAPEAALGLAVMEVVASHGGARAAALHRAAAAARERRAVVHERAVQSAQARLSALVLTLVPIGFAIWTTSTDPRVAHFLLGTPFGWGCLALGLGLNLGGWWWMRRVIGGST